MSIQALRERLAASNKAAKHLLAEKGSTTWTTEDQGTFDNHADEGRCYCRLCIMSAGATDRHLAAFMVSTVAPRCGHLPRRRIPRDTNTLHFHNTPYWELHPDAASNRDTGKKRHVFESLCAKIGIRSETAMQQNLSR